MLSSTERYLVDSIQNGDRKAFEFVFRTYYADLCRYARNIIQLDATAEDLVMDIFTRLWETEKKLVINSSLPGYLFTSVHNHCLNYLTRKHKRFTELDNETIEKLNRLIPDENISGTFENLSAIDLSALIEKSIDRLPEECRRIFILSRSEGLSNREISTRLEISENTVKVQIYRALKKLRVALREFLSTNILL